MATHVIPPRIIKNLHYNTTTKPLNTTHSSLSPTIALSSLFEKPPSPAADAPPAAATLSLDDAERLFGSVSMTRLLRSSAVLHTMAVGPVVDLGTRVMKLRVFQSGVLRNLVMAATRETFLAHFCTGEDAAAVAGWSIKQLNDAGLRGMLVYGVEDAHDNKGCDCNLQGFLHNVDVSKSLPT